MALKYFYISLCPIHILGLVNIAGLVWKQFHNVECGTPQIIHLLQNPWVWKHWGIFSFAGFCLNNIFWPTNWLIESFNYYWTPKKLIKLTFLGIPDQLSFFKATKSNSGESNKTWNFSIFVSYSESWEFEVNFCNCGRPGNAWIWRIRGLEEIRKRIKNTFKLWENSSRLNFELNI